MIAPAEMPRQGTAAASPGRVSKPPLHDSKHASLQPVTGSGWKIASWRRDPPYPSLTGRCSRHNLQQHLGSVL